METYDGMELRQPPSSQPSHSLLLRRNLAPIWIWLCKKWRVLDDLRSCLSRPAATYSDKSGSTPIVHSCSSDGTPLQEPSGGEGADGGGSVATDLRSRWASRAKATLSNTTKELRSFWGRAASSGHDPGGASTALFTS